ncbi:MAG: PAS domain-containing protein [Spirochaetota bacterium]
MDTENTILLRAIQNVLDLVPGGIVIIDETNAIVLCNQYFAHTICKKNKEFIMHQNIT